MWGIEVGDRGILPTSALRVAQVWHSEGWGAGSIMWPLLEDSLGCSWTLLSGKWISREPLGSSMGQLTANGDRSTWKDHLGTQARQSWGPQKWLEETLLCRHGGEKEVRTCIRKVGTQENQIQAISVNLALFVPTGWWSHDLFKYHLDCCFQVNVFNDRNELMFSKAFAAAAAAAKSLQLCPTLCNPTDGSPPGSSIPGILQQKLLVWDN